MFFQQNNNLNISDDGISGEHVIEMENVDETKNEPILIEAIHVEPEQNVPSTPLGSSTSSTSSTPSTPPDPSHRVSTVGSYPGTRGSSGENNSGWLLIMLVIGVLLISASSNNDDEKKKNTHDDDDHHNNTMASFNDADIDIDIQSLADFDAPNNLFNIISAVFLFSAMSYICIQLKKTNSESQSTIEDDQSTIEDDLECAEQGSSLKM